MVDVCPKCGNYDWNKAVDGEKMTCPKCGRSWGFLKLPLFIVAGASGVGKTSALHALQALTQEYICLDSDFFYNLMPHETMEDYLAQTEQLQALSLDLMQCGKPVVWAKTGNLPLLSQTYHARFFSGIPMLALTCGEEALRRRMELGRGIKEKEWLQSSIEYNRYFQEHEKIGDIPYERLRTDDLTAEEAARRIEGWLMGKLRPSRTASKEL